MTYLIDGYNLIGAMSYISLSDPDKESKLTSLLNDSPLLKKHKATVIFDGKGDLATTETRLKIGKITVIYTENTSTADDLIKDKLHMAQPNNIILVSSDRELINRAKKYKIKSVSSPDFIKIITQVGSKSTSAPSEKPSNPDTDYWINQFMEKK